MLTNRTQPPARIIVPDNPPPPPTCIECHKPIGALILAVTPRNPRPHMVLVPTAYIPTQAGPVCPACWQTSAPERELVIAVDREYALKLAPVTLPAELPDDLLRIYTSNGQVIRTEPLVASKPTPRAVRPPSPRHRKSNGR